MARIALGLVVCWLGLGVGDVAAQATEESPAWLSGNVTVTSDYAFRGISQTLREPAIQGGLDFAGPRGLYAGIWGSSLNFGEDLSGGARAQLELDAYAGIARDLYGVSWRLGAIYYGYPGAADARNYDYVEVGVGAARDFGVADASVSAAYSPDFFAGSGDGLYLSSAVGIPLWSVFSLGLAVGHQTIEDNAAFGADDYLHWQGSLSADLYGFTLTAAYVDTDVSGTACFGGTDLCEARGVFSISRSR